MMARLSALILLVLLSTASVAQTSNARQVQRVVFVCEHGSVKSLIAASYFNRSARARGLPFEAIARGTAPESTVPRIVQDGLNADSLSVSGYVPLLLRATDIRGAALVVSFDQDIAATLDSKVPLLKWDNLPSVLAEYPRGRDAILERVNALVDTLSQAPGLMLEGKIPLGDIRGRLDHLAVDLGRQRLYVAELGNDSVGVVDIKEHRTIRTLTGLREPQGIAHVASTDTVYVANAGDGSVRLFQGADLAPVAQLALGDDADNVRVDNAAHRVFVGYGSGAVAIIDTGTRTKIGEIALKGHPESFRLDASGMRIFVNVPDAHEIAVIDRAAHRQIAGWKTGIRFSNYPLALDEQGRVLVVFRHPARLTVFQPQDGQEVSVVPTCGDSDDLFVDGKRHRVYVSCGEGFIDVFAGQGSGYARVAHMPTVSGARTSLFVPEMDRLFLAVRASGDTSASIWVFRPTD